MVLLEAQHPPAHCVVVRKLLQPTALPLILFQLYHLFSKVGDTSAPHGGQDMAVLWTRQP